MSNYRDRLKAREAALEAELDRRRNRSATERQVEAALGRQPKTGDNIERNPEAWTTTDRQLRAAGIEPRRRYPRVKPSRPEPDDD
jgi:hypothetical protein